MTTELHSIYTIYLFIYSCTASFKGTPLDQVKIIMDLYRAITYMYCDIRQQRPGS